MPSPQLASLIQMLRAQPAGERSFEEMREGMEAMSALLPPAADLRIDTVDGVGVPAEWVMAPGASDERALLYLHGGGYCIGSNRIYRDFAGRLSRASGLRVLTIDYRLAPEHPHPAAVDDATAAYRWLLAQGFEPRRLAVAGDSAGGGLTVATLVALRDAGVTLPATGVCISPWIDLEGGGASMDTKAAEDPMVQRDGLLRMAAAYLGEHSPRTPLAAPLYADLRGLPPLLVHVGTAETLLDDAVRLEARGREAGVDVTLEPWDDMIHVWHVFAGLLPEGQQATERVGEYLRKRVA
jgi:acetyl esterase/lipase